MKNEEDDLDEILVDEEGDEDIDFFYETLKEVLNKHIDVNITTFEGEMVFGLVSRLNKSQVQLKQLVPSYGTPDTDSFVAPTIRSTILAIDTIQFLSWEENHEDFLEKGLNSSDKS